MLARNSAFSEDVPPGKLVELRGAGLVRQRLRHDLDAVAHGRCVDGEVGREPRSLRAAGLERQDRRSGAHRCCEQRVDALRRADVEDRFALGGVAREQRQGVGLVAAGPVELAHGAVEAELDRRTAVDAVGEHPARIGRDLLRDPEVQLGPCALGEAGLEFAQRSAAATGGEASTDRAISLVCMCLPLDRTGRSYGLGDQAMDPAAPSSVRCPQAHPRRLGPVGRLLLDG
ncbi:hypothetical protein ACE2AJ_18855 [Aquihabitans daechungensis]|uniref:hypothetical protein n=1 Tax=Aquihabitans daechungensis TaxID=1052257 RepID=UPI003BA30D65